MTTKKLHCTAKWFLTEKNRKEYIKYKIVGNVKAMGQHNKVKEKSLVLVLLTESDP